MHTNRSARARSLVGLGSVLIAADALDAGGCGDRDRPDAAEMPVPFADGALTLSASAPGVSNDREYAVVPGLPSLQVGTDCLRE